MTEPEIDIERGLLFYRVSIDFTDSDSETRAKYLANKKPIKAEIEDWVTQTRNCYIKDGWPDPFRKVEHNDGDFWCYWCDNGTNQEKASWTAGFSFIENRCGVFSREAEEMRMLLSANAFLHHDDKKNTLKAYQSLAEFVHYQTLNDAERSGRDDILRSRKIMSSAYSGARERARETSQATEFILREMKRIIDAGHSIARAAALSHGRGFGKSAAANKQLWYRHRKK